MLPTEPEDERRAEDERGATDSAADNILVDGRIVGPPHTDRSPEDDEVDSPKLDAEVQSGGKERA